MKLFSLKRKSFSTVLGIVFLSLAIAACGNSAPATGTGGSTPAPAAATNGKGCTKVGVLLPETASSARWDGVDKPLLEQKIPAAIPGATVDYANAGGDSTVQQTQADAALTKGDCILIVAAHDSDAAATIVAKAKLQGVPVIAYDRLIQSKDLNYYVSFDNEKVGELQGQYIADHYKDFTKDGTNVAMIDGGQTDNNAILFHQGALAKLQPLFDAKTLTKVYDQYTDNWDNDKARTEMDGVLAANQNKIQIAYVANDGMANSVIAALKAKQLNGKVLVTGQDATVAGIQNIITGDQTMTVYKPIVKEVDAAVSLAKALHDGTDTASLTNGITVKTKDGTGIPSVLEQATAVDKANLASTVIADGFVTLADACKGLPAKAGGICP
ncbi:MAG TPA: sugar ABC transporter substrate-binding protein [Ktedonosporobacter sp.]|nr:sugar ABC transporter substrate-binding protein [Ktedonosporobacter sp.]